MFISYKQGTTQFIAKGILDGFAKKRHVARDVHHDLESFLLVIIYSFYRRFTMLHPYDTELRQEYHDLFGNISPSQISAQRNQMFMEDALPELSRTIADDGLRYLVGIFCRLIHVQNLPKVDYVSQLRSSFKPNAPGGPGLPLRQLITYDQVDMYLKALLPSSDQA
jgi:hypothetical protein